MGFNLGFKGLSEVLDIARHLRLKPPPFRRKDLSPCLSGKWRDKTFSVGLFRKSCLLSLETKLKCRLSLYMHSAGIRLWEITEKKNDVLVKIQKFLKHLRH